MGRGIGLSDRWMKRNVWILLPASSPPAPLPFGRCSASLAATDSAKGNIRRQRRLWSEDLRQRSVRALFFLCKAADANRPDRSAKRAAVRRSDSSWAERT
jgi:hypothetical protein